MMKLVIVALLAVCAIANARGIAGADNGVKKNVRLLAIHIFF